MTNIDPPKERIQWMTRDGVAMTLRKVKSDDVPLLLWASENFSTGSDMMCLQRLSRYDSKSVTGLP
jgi:hypothetical protein